MDLFWSLNDSDFRLFTNIALIGPRKKTSSQRPKYSSKVASADLAYSKMWRSSIVVCLLVHAAVGVKVKVVMHSDQEESKEDDSWSKVTMLPFLKTVKDHEEVQTTERAVTLHPNEVLFPLIYKQSHINSMFMFGQNWYTWSTEKRTDGSKAINYYICYDEPKHCDDVGWERTDALPKCAFQIDSLMPEDRACINAFGVEPHSGAGCDGGEQMKVGDIVHACGPRIRSLWRFVRVGRRPAGAAKPADVNSLVCEDEEECVVNVEYRIHHDRITFSLHEPSRGQTFKSALKRDLGADEEIKPTTETRASHSHRNKKVKEDSSQNRYKKYLTKPRPKVVEGKGVVKENDSGYGRRLAKNKIKFREDVSDDISD